MPKYILRTTKDMIEKQNVVRATAAQIIATLKDFLSSCPSLNVRTE